jgi:hypothetical protein
VAKSWSVSSEEADVAVVLFVALVCELACFLLPPILLSEGKINWHRSSKLSKNEGAAGIAAGGGGAASAAGIAAADEEAMISAMGESECIPALSAVGSRRFMF